MVIRTDDITQLSGLPGLMMKITGSVDDAHRRDGETVVPLTKKYYGKDIAGNGWV
jgi:hypothetical protein